MLESLIDQLHGPYGGIVALAFGMGCASGYSFAMKTALVEARRRIDELRDELDAARLAETVVRERYLKALETQTWG